MLEPQKETSRRLFLQIIQDITGWVAAALSKREGSFPESNEHKVWLGARKGVQESAMGNGLLRVWMMGLAVGLKSLRKEPVLGLKRPILPVSYWRAAEFAYVWRSLGRFSAGARVLDVGSPKVSRRCWPEVEALSSWRRISCLKR